MKITVKARFNATQQRLEKFSPGNYLMYLGIPEAENAVSVIAYVMAKQLGVQLNKIAFQGRDVHGNYIFEVLA
jgi:hypothetical protein